MSKDDALWAEQLLERARATAAPHPGDAARNLASIEARLGIGAGLAAPRARAPRPAVGSGLEAGGARRAASGGLSTAGLVKGGLVLAFGVGSGIIGYLIGRAETERARDPIAAAAPAAASTPSPVAATAVVADPAASFENTDETEQPPAPVNSAEPSPRRESAAVVLVAPERRARPAGVGRARAVRPPAAAAPTDGFDLSQALELLRRAEAAVRREDGLEARMWLSDLDRRAAPQLLLEERLVTRVLADCLVGDAQAAAATLRELEVSNSESMYRARLEGSCVADQMQTADSKSRAVRH